MLSIDQQKALDATLLDVVEKIKSKHFVNNLEMSTYYRRSPTWTCHVRTTLLASGLLTADEWTAGFTKRGKPTSRNVVCPKCSHVFSTLKDKSHE